MRKNLKKPDFAISAYHGAWCACKKLRLLWKADVKGFRLVTSEVKLNFKKKQGTKISIFFHACRKMYQFYGREKECRDNTLSTVHGISRTLWYLSLVGIDFLGRNGSSQTRAFRTARRICLRKATARRHTILHGRHGKAWYVSRCKGWQNCYVLLMTKPHTPVISTPLSLHKPKTTVASCCSCLSL